MEKTQQRCKDCVNDMTQKEGATWLRFMEFFFINIILYIQNCIFIF